MGWFTKESHTHFNRDENGKVISVEGSESIGDRLIRQSKTGGSPGRWKKFKTGMRERAAVAYVQNKKMREVYRDAYNEARLRRARDRGRAAGYGLSEPVYVKPGHPSYVKLNVDSGSSLLGYPIPDYDTYGKRKYKGGKKKKSGGSKIPDFMNMKPW